MTRRIGKEGLYTRVRNKSREINEFDDTFEQLTDSWAELSDSKFEFNRYESVLRDSHKSED